jgi:hypothetical protein
MPRFLILQVHILMTPCLQYLEALDLAHFQPEFDYYLVCELIVRVLKLKMAMGQCPRWPAVSKPAKLAMIILGKLIYCGRKH